MVTLKQAIELVNQKLKNSEYEYYRGLRADHASEFENGWRIGFPHEGEFGGLYYVSKKTGEVLPYPSFCKYEKSGSVPVPDDVFHREAGY